VHMCKTVGSHRTAGSRHKHTNIHESSTPRPNGTNRCYLCTKYHKVL